MSATLDFTAPSQVLARDLIGAMLTLDGVGGVIVETEAYDASDPASHSFIGLTARNSVMFGPVGRTYVYRIYGMHDCLNIVCGPQPGGAVLLRALEPVSGIEAMLARRGLQPVRTLCAGPGRLCQALGVTRAQNDMAIDAPPFSLTAPTKTQAVAIGPRIGISKAVDQPWRFGLAGSPFLSRRFQATG